MASLPVAAGEAVPETVLPLCHHRGVSAPRKSAKGIGPWGLCPQTPEVYRLFLRGSATGIGFRTAKRNEKERYRMASPPRKPAGARVAPQRCPILRLLTVIVYHLLPLFSTVQYSIVLDMGSTLQRVHERVQMHPLFSFILGFYDRLSGIRFRLCGIPNECISGVLSGNHLLGRRPRHSYPPSIIELPVIPADGHGMTQEQLQIGVHTIVHPMHH